MSLVIEVITPSSLHLLSLLTDCQRVVMEHSLILLAAKSHLAVYEELSYFQLSLFSLPLSAIAPATFVVVKPFLRLS